MVHQPELFPDAPRILPAKVAAKERDAFSLIPSELVAPSKQSSAFKTISEAAKMLSLPQYVLRFWESKFKQIKPLKMKGGRRYYRPEDIETLATIKRLLYKEGYTIKGAHKAFDELKKTKKAAKAPMRKSVQAAPLLDAVRQSALSSRIENQKKLELEALKNELLYLKSGLKIEA